MLPPEWEAGKCVNRATGLCVPGFLKLLWFAGQYLCVCVSICVSIPRALITKGIICCDIDRV